MPLPAPKTPESPESPAPPEMRAGGEFLVNGRLVDAFGVPIEAAPDPEAAPAPKKSRARAKAEAGLATPPSVDAHGTDEVDPDDVPPDSEDQGR